MTADINLVVDIAEDYVRNMGERPLRVASEVWSHRTDDDLYLVVFGDEYAVAVNLGNREVTSDFDYDEIQDAIDSEGGVKYDVS